MTTEEQPTAQPEIPPEHLQIEFAEDKNDER